MTFPWTDNTLNVSREGALAVAPYPAEIVSRKAEGAIRAGLLVERGTAYDQVKPIAALPAADPNAINATAMLSAVAAAHHGPATFDGVVGASRIHPPQRLSLTLNAHADWPDGMISVQGEGPGGEMLVEDVLIPAGGNIVLYTHGIFSLASDIWLPACGGVNGELLVGTEPTYYGVDPRGYPGIALYDRDGEPSATTTVTIDDEGDVSLLRKGWVWVIVEAAVVHGAPAYVRMVLAGSNVRGQWRGSPATGFCRVPGAQFITSQASVGGLATLEIGGR